MLPKGKSEALNRRRTDNAMTEEKQLTMIKEKQLTMIKEKQLTMIKEKQLTMIYKTLHRKLRIK